MLAKIWTLPQEKTSKLKTRRKLISMERKRIIGGVLRPENLDLEETKQILRRCNNT